MSGNTQHIVHSPRGVHAQWDGTAFTFMEVERRHYHPIMIQASLGIPINRTDCYFDANRNQLTEHRWVDRYLASGKPEYIYMTGSASVNLGHAIIRSGTTESLE